MFRSQTTCLYWLSCGDLDLDRLGNKKIGSIDGILTDWWWADTELRSRDPKWSRSHQQEEIRDRSYRMPLGMSTYYSLLAI